MIVTTNKIHVGDIPEKGYKEPNISKLRDDEESQQNSNTKGRAKQEKDLSQKYLLTLEEAARYTGIGINKLREISSDDNCSFVLWNGSHRLLKRNKLEEFIDKAFSI